MSHFLMGNTLAKIIKWEVVKKFEPTVWKVAFNGRYRGTHTKFHQMADSE